MGASSRGATIGILYCGDMGSAFARALRRSGARVVTTCEGRSRATADRARAAGVEILKQLDDVVAQSDFVFSLVLPSAAFEVAQQYARCRGIRASDGVYVETNSIGLATLSQIEEVMAAHDISWVDAAIHGPAAQLRQRSVLYVSGPSARTVEQICSSSMRVSWVGEHTGSASRMKLTLSGVSKTLVAMFLEIGTLADRSEMMDSWLENCRHFYPGIMTVVEPMLLTYPRHASRRVGEVRALEKFAEASQVRLGIAHEAGDLLDLVATIDWKNQEWKRAGDLRSIIRCVAHVRQEQGGGPVPRRGKK